MPKPEHKKLRKEYDQLLEEIWKLWDRVQSHEDIEEFEDPFESTYFVDITDLNDEERGRFHRDVGWILGVSAAMGWSKGKPGPREWSPRD